MAVKKPFQTSSIIIDKHWLRKALAAGTNANHAPAEPKTIEELHAMMLADGVRPEDNEASQEILHHRYPDASPAWQPRKPEGQE